MLTRGDNQLMPTRATVSRGLVIDQPWVGLIADGKKTWEMRTRATRVRGWIGLIEKGSGTVVGLAYLNACLPALSRREHHLHYRRHRIPADTDRKTYAGRYLVPWVMSNAFRLPKPLPYKHPSGAVIWVTFTEDVARKLTRHLLMAGSAGRI